MIDHDLLADAIFIGVMIFATIGERQVIFMATHRGDIEKRGVTLRKDGADLVGFVKVYRGKRMVDFLIFQHPGLVVKVDVIPVSRPADINGLFQFLIPKVLGGRGNHLAAIEDTLKQETEVNSDQHTDFHLAIYEIGPLAPDIFTFDRHGSDVIASFDHIVNEGLAKCLLYGKHQ